MSRDVTQTYVYRLGASQVTIGRFTYGMDKKRILQWNEGANLTIGSFCSIAGGGAIFLGGGHRSDWVTTFPFGHIFQEHLGNPGVKGHPVTRGDVEIGHDVWMGENVTIMSGISIGSGAVIAANSHVAKSIEPYSIAGGNPARHIRYRFPEEVVDLLLRLRWWDLALADVREIATMLCQSPSVDLLNQLIKKFRDDEVVATTV